MTSVTSPTIPSETEMAAIVEAGMTFLDAIEPGWLGPVDLGVFDVANPDRCAVGQSLGFFYVHSEALARRAYTGTTPLGDSLDPYGDRVNDILAPYGFTVPTMYWGTEEAENNYWTALNDAWRTAITARRLAAEEAGNDNS